MSNSFYLGKVVSLDTESFNKDEHVIKVNIPEVNKEVLAFPLYNLDTPRVDDEVIVFNMNPNLNNVFIYQPLRKFKDNYPFNGFNYNEGNIEISNEGKINISNSKYDMLTSLKELVSTLMTATTLKGDTLSISTKKKLNKVAAMFNNLLYSK